MRSSHFNNLGNVQGTIMWNPLWLSFLLPFLTQCLSKKTIEHSYRAREESAPLLYDPVKFEVANSGSPRIFHDEFDWTYERLRDSLSNFNNGFFEYADRLSGHIKSNFKYKPKFLACRDKVNEKELEKRHNIQDKVNLQESLDDLQAKYDALEQALEKVEDINEDNKESIARLRSHRDRCVQNLSNRKKTIDSLRDEATELRRQITHARSQVGN